MKKKINKKLLLGLIGTLLILSGCSSQLYHWKNYSKSKYQYKKNNNLETELAYKESLEEVITYNESMGKKVPPGVCCELAQINQKMGNNKVAMALFEKEKELYPESETFVNLIIKQITENKKG